MSRGAKVGDGKRFSRMERMAPPCNKAILLKASWRWSVPKKDKLSESKACFVFPIDPSAPAIGSAFAGWMEGQDDSYRFLKTRRNDLPVMSGKRAKWRAMFQLWQELACDASRK
jgi:hypothetical protein